MIGIGLLFIYGHRLRIHYILSAVLIHTAMLPVTVFAVKKYGGDLIQGFFIAGISYVMDDTNFDVFSELVMIYVLSILSMLAVYFGIWFGKRFRFIVSVATLFISADTEEYIQRVFFIETRKRSDGQNFPKMIF